MAFPKVMYVREDRPGSYFIAEKSLEDIVRVDGVTVVGVYIFKEMKRARKSVIIE